MNQLLRESEQAQQHFNDQPASPSTGLHSLNCIASGSRKQSSMSASPVEMHTSSLSRRALVACEECATAPPASFARFVAQDGTHESSPPDRLSLLNSSDAADDISHCGELFQLFAAKFGHLNLTSTDAGHLLTHMWKTQTLFNP
jgi:hypothetical protein